MNDIDKLELLEQLFEIPDRNIMETKLQMNGYSRNYLDYLTDNQLKHLYYDEFDM